MNAQKRDWRLTEAIAVVGLIALISLSACASARNGSTEEFHKGDRLSSFSQEINSPVHDFQVKGGDTYTLELDVKNTGSQPWFAGADAFSVAAGYRWVDSNGNVLPIEGNRAVLTRSIVRPGENDRLMLHVTAPALPGSYTLRVSMVQEGVSWFSERGANPLILRVAVS